MHIRLIIVRLWNCSSHMFIILQCHCDKVKSSNSCVWDSGFACRQLDDQIVVLIVAHSKFNDSLGVLILGVLCSLELVNL